MALVASLAHRPVGSAAKTTSPGQWDGRTTRAGGWSASGHSCSVAHLARGIADADEADEGDGHLGCGRVLQRLDRLQVLQQRAVRMDVMQETCIPLKGSRRSKNGEAYVSKYVRTQTTHEHELEKSFLQRCQAHLSHHGAQPTFQLLGRAKVWMMTRLARRDKETP
jgi:hypothetical protein